MVQIAESLTVHCSEFKERFKTMQLLRKFLQHSFASYNTGGLAKLIGLSACVPIAASSLQFGNYTTRF